MEISKIKSTDIDENNNVVELSLVNLNDDCLIEIFKYVDGIELYYLTKVSKRFKCIVSSSIRNGVLNLRKLPKALSATQILKTIGKSLSTLTATAKNDKYLNTISHCNKFLLHLDIEINLNVVSELLFYNYMESLVNLKTIKIKQTSSEFEIIHFLQKAKNIGRIELCHCELNPSCNITFPNLRSLKLIGCSLDLNYFEDLMKDIGNNLEEFEIDHLPPYQDGVVFRYERMLSIINEYLINLTKLTLFTYYKDVQTFENLTKLKTLSVVIYFSETGDYEFIKNFSNIKHLKITFDFMNMNKTTAALREFKSLKTLELKQLRTGLNSGLDDLVAANVEKIILTDYSLSHTELLGFIKKCQNLRLLDISGSNITFTKGLYKKILSAIEARESEMSLMIRTSRKSVKNLVNYDKNIVNVV